MDKCTCKITPGTSAYGGNQIDSRGCEKHDTRDEIIEQLRQERDNALRYTELLIAERDAARAREARAVAALKEIAVFAQGLRERSDVSTFVVIGHMIEGYLNKHAARAAALRAGEVGDE